MKNLIALVALSGVLAVQAAPVNLENVQKFARGLSIESNIHRLEAMGLNDFEMSNPPWTSSFLPANRGYAANNYHEKNGNLISFISGEFSYSSNRKEYFEDLEDFQSGRITLTPEVVATLSTADKYDLLIGNFRNDTSLSHRLFDMADYIHDQFGTLTQWTGMCHGWAPASVAHPAPLSTVYLISVDGRYRIPFYPNDIKSLLTIPFANSTRAFMNDHRIQTSGNPDDWSKEGIMPMIGNACRQGSPRVDRRNGGRIRMSDNDRNSSISNCEDVNSAFYHLAILNLMGRHNQALVVDIDHNDKVNNHPTAGFKLKYFNPSNQNFYNSYRAAMAEVGTFNDSRREFRNPRARYIVGVEIEMNFVDYRYFGKKIATDVDIQKYKKRTFDYDLELDAQGNIIGGEWVNDLVERNIGPRGRGRRRIIERAGHKPDFLWYAPKGMRAEAYLETEVQGSWNSPNQPIPQAWAQAAINASYQTNLDFASNPDSNGNFPFRPQPEVIFGIAEKLLEFSRR